MLRLQLDEHMSNDLLNELRKKGFAVVHPKDIGLRGTSDDTELAYATREGRVFITDDTDYLRMHRYAQNHAGIAFCGPQLRNARQIVKTLRKLSKETTADEMIGRLIYLSNILRAIGDEPDDDD